MSKYGGDVMQAVYNFPFIWGAERVEIYRGALCGVGSGFLAKEWRLSFMSDRPDIKDCLKSAHLRFLKAGVEFYGEESTAARGFDDLTFRFAAPVIFGEGLLHGIDLISWQRPESAMRCCLVLIGTRVTSS